MISLIHYQGINQISCILKITTNKTLTFYIPETQFAFTIFTCFRMTFHFRIFFVIALI